MEYETVIGLEVHAQLNTKSKMYCRCSSAYADAMANSHVCPVCLGLPGVLPVINKRAVEFTMMTALALNCSVSEYTRFDRKNYPYPDLMKGYQISQFDKPVGLTGWLNIEVDGQQKKVGITRVHLEEDVAKLLHREAPVEGAAHSLVDVNRSGVPLMEIVGEPDLRSPEEARQYLMKLRQLLRYLGVSTANMEEGSFRCDANISIRPKGSDELRSKIEVKNMNSFKAVYNALEYEAKRQRQATERGQKLTQETRGWVEAEGRTVSQRSKEYAHDYRYMPEPDLPPIEVAAAWVDEVRKELPELPEARCSRFMEEYGLSLYDADLLTGSRPFADYYEACLKTPEFAGLPEGKRHKEVANWLLGEVSRIMNDNNLDIEAFSREVPPERLVKLAGLSAKAVVNVATAREVLDEMFKSGQDAASIIEKRGLSQISDADALGQVVDEVIKNNPQPVADFRAGKVQAAKFLVGQVMKATRGRANPAVIGDLIKQKLEEG